MHKYSISSGFGHFQLFLRSFCLNFVLFSKCTYALHQTHRMNLKFMEMIQHDVVPKILFILKFMTYLFDRPKSLHSFTRIKFKILKNYPKNVFDAFGEISVRYLSVFIQNAIFWDKKLMIN